MKKHFKNLMIAMALIAASTTVQAQWWNVTGGNAGTNPNTDYVGTNDSKPLIFRVKGIKAGRIDFANNIANTSIGFQTLNPLSPGIQNAAFGFQALKLNTGINNSALGYRALFNNISGSQNTGIGASALYFNTTGFGNTASGYASLFTNTTGYDNTANGTNALRLNTTGYFNTATGYQSLNNNTTGFQNTANGANSLFTNATGSNNTANGSQALYLNATGSNNTANGVNALYANTTGSNNTANGVQSLTNNTTGSANTSTGYQALLKNVVGNYNTATGYAALYYNTADNNTATGHGALFSNKVGTSNTAGGLEDLYSNTIGNNNTGTGYRALYNNDANNNTATGWQSLYLNTTGTNNSAVGYNALFYNTTGFNNTALGYAAGVSFNSTVDNTTTVGANAFVNMSSGTNATAIGANAIATNSNTMQLGSPITTVYINNGVVVTSDGRFKDDIKEKDAPGLEFINKLRPVSYKFNYKRFDDFIRKDMDASKNKTDAAYRQQLIEKGKQREVGFIAQEVEKTVKDNSYTFNGVYVPQNSNDHYGLDYSKFVVPLVKSVQELSKENDDLKTQLLALSKRIEALENASVSSSQNNSQLTKSNNSYLYQIAPNPFSQKATISFKLSSSVSNAQLVITDATGKIIKTCTLSDGSTQQDIYANNLTAGVYHYSLVVNGKMIDSKQMVITK